MRPLRSQLWDASGGLPYHWRALRHRKTLWQPFVTQVGRWLAAWQPPQQELLLIGPSAGYTLDAAFLARFGRVTVLEPDPLARWLLQRRFPRIHFEQASIDCFAHREGAHWLARLFPHSAILFANVLGQKLATLPAGWPEQLPIALQGHSWASYHDVVACAQTPEHASEQMPEQAQALEKVLARFWSMPTGKVLEVFDHGSFERLPAAAYAVWSLTPQQHHLVAWSSMSVGGSSMLPNTGIGGRS